MKKGYLLILVPAVVILGTVIAFSLVRNSEKTCDDEKLWIKFDELDDFGDFLDSPIERIALRKGANSHEWAVFDDDELVSEWDFYFTNARIKRDSEKTPGIPEHNVDEMFITVFGAGGREFHFYAYYLSGECMLDIGGAVYSTKYSTDFPFKSTYRQAVERHGITTSWEMN